MNSMERHKAMEMRKRLVELSEEYDLWKDKDKMIAEEVEQETEELFREFKGFMGQFEFEAENRMEEILVECAILCMKSFAGMNSGMDDVRYRVYDECPV